MITKEFLKTEIDKVQEEFLDALYRIIKAFESPVRSPFWDRPVEASPVDHSESNWHDFITATYGCLADDPIERGPQGEYETREAMP